MKRLKPKTKRSKADTMRVRDLLAQPSSAFYRLPEFEVRGGYLLTDGCRRVLDFAPEKICLDMGAFTVTFYGANLRIESLVGKRLVIAGRFAHIEFRSKWEEPGHEE